MDSEPVSFAKAGRAIAVMAAAAFAIATAGIVYVDPNLATSSPNPTPSVYRVVARPVAPSEVYVTHAASGDSVTVHWVYLDSRSEARKSSGSRPRSSISRPRS